MKKNYKTKQRQLILDAVIASAGTHFTVEEIYHKLMEQGYDLGRATVYRKINELQAEGTIKKFVSESGKSACYEYISDSDNNFYHFKCTDCKELIHMDCESLTRVKEHLLQKHGFELDESKMIFLGRCRHCREQ